MLSTYHELAAASKRHPSAFMFTAYHTMNLPVGLEARWRKMRALPVVRMSPSNTLSLHYNSSYLSYTYVSLLPIYRHCACQQKMSEDVVVSSFQEYGYQSASKVLYSVELQCGTV